MRISFENGRNIIGFPLEIDWEFLKTQDFSSYYRRYVREDIREYTTDWGTTYVYSSARATTFTTRIDDADLQYYQRYMYRVNFDVT